jgi:hypothetical protein
MLNVDIPSCNNNVHFELIRDIKFALFDSFGLVDIIERIDDNTVTTKDGKTYDMATLFTGDYYLKPMTVK